MKLKYILISIVLLCGLYSAASNVIPNVTIRNSSSPVSGMVAANTINGSGMNVVAVNGLHDNDAAGATMWSSNYQWSEISITFDLKISYDVESMYVWNFNQEGNTNNGIKNAKIQYSVDNKTWIDVPNPNSTNTKYPFQFSQATGLKNMPATNLNDSKNTPVSINSLARYIRIIAPQIGSADEGNWGGNAVGLSEVIFTTAGEVPDGYRVDVNTSEIVNTCGNLLFGGCHSPSYAQGLSILPLFIDAGMNTIRADLWIETIVPKLSSVEDYYNNVNDCQNPDKWDYTNVELWVRAKQAGMKTMCIISYCPDWLAYNGKTNGVPKDMAVYTDIVRKIYSRYHQYIDYVEFYNEPGYFFTIENSPYTSVGKALADMYVACYDVVQSITPGKHMGGLSVVTHADGGVGGITNRDFFSDPRITKDNFNYYSHHVYSDYGIETSKETVTRVKEQLNKFGFGDLPVWFTEWSSSINNAKDSVTYIGSKSHTFVGKCLVNWMKDGLTGAHHWNYMEAVTIGAAEAGSNRDGHGMYAWNSNTKTGYLLPKAFVFKMMSKSLGLGQGENKVMGIINTASDLLNIGAFINNAGEKTVIAVNEQESPVKIDLKMAGLKGVKKIDQYTVTFYKKGEVPTSVSFTPGDDTKLVIEIPASSVVGLKFIE